MKYAFLAVTFVIGALAWYVDGAETRWRQAMPPGPGVAALRVCANPNNLPLSNREGEGLENRLAILLAREMRRSLEYTWSSPRPDVVRNMIREGKCNVVLGVPASYDVVSVTRPYYRDIAVGVRRGDEELRREIDGVLLARADEIRALLDEFGIPGVSGRTIADRQ